MPENPDTQVDAVRPGRKPAKHSNPDYVQTSLYLPREGKNKVRARLLEQGKELSELVEDMLRDWLLKQG
jgi:hypothetical protein